MEKQIISVSVFVCQSGATVNMVSSWVRTDGKQAATGVSQNSRSHVRSPEVADARSEAFFEKKAHSAQTVLPVQLGSQ